MEIVINEVEDMLTVAAILVKNGYTVRRTKRKRDGNNRAFDMVLIVTKEAG